MFTSLSYNNFKGTSESITLDRVTVITGKNESGKSAACDALRLAATGRTEIGAIAASLAKLVSSSQARVIAIGRGIEASWAINGTKRDHQVDPTLQGGMPVTPKEFWGLSGAERLELIAPAGSLAKLSDRIATLEQEAKRLKNIVNEPTPQQPPQYTGKPIDQLRAEIESIDAKTARHKAAQKNEWAIQERNQAIQNATMAKPGLEKNVAEARVWVEKAVAERDAAAEQLNEYNTDTLNEPVIIQSARTRGVEYKKAVMDTANVLAAALNWGGYVSIAGDLIDAIENGVGNAPIQDHPLSMRNGKPILHASREAASEADRAIFAVNSAGASLARCSETLLAPLPEAIEGLLSQDEFASLVEARELAKQSVSDCERWGRYDQDLQALATRRVMAQGDLSTTEVQLAAARNALSEEVNNLKGPVEDLTNQYLSVAQYEPLSISIENSGRKWVMNVTIGSVDLEALADSKRLIYDLCLLSAIHDLSGAKCPILVAKCAEMDGDKMRLAVKALKLRAKGNVVLEHHIDPKITDQGVSVINLSNGSLVTA
jgi:uncharacterized small protein (DUF1192 family)